MTYYSKVPPRYLTDHLAENIRGLENINVMNLQQAMTNWCKEDPHMPEYVNRLEDLQKKVARPSLPILDVWLTSIATSSILAENSFPTAQEKWDELPIAEKHGQSGRITSSIPKPRFNAPRDPAVDLSAAPMPRLHSKTRAPLSCPTTRRSP